MTSLEPVAALSLDAGGALLHPVEPVARTYARAAAAHGGSRTEAEVAAAFAAAFATPWRGPRYVGDGRPFWRRVVREATGVASPTCFEALYAHYESPTAWRVATGASAALARWRAAGGRVALVSDWDTRLRPLVEALGLAPLFDGLIISAEVGAEKPDPRIFCAATRSLGLRADRVLHLGDSDRRDAEGALAAGLRALRWTGDAPPLADVVDTLLAGGLPSGTADQSSARAPRSGNTGGPRTSAESR